MTKLFLPGPTDVHPEVLARQAQPMISHRSQACADLIGRIQPKLRHVFSTHNRVMLATASGSGLQEAAVRNLVTDRLLVCTCGAFGERWFQIAQANGITVDALEVPWGQPNLPEDVERALRQQPYDALALVHNETSTGVENPLDEIARRARSLRPEILILVDAVSSAGGVELLTDAWGLDVVLTSSQKCFALPPGMAFAAVSDRALEKARQVPHRGWYFDFLQMDEYLARNLTPSTPAISLLYALDAQLDRMLAEGLPARYARHAAMAAYVQAWAQERFALLAPDGYRSRTATTIRNTLGLDLDALHEHLARHGMQIADGYGRLKGETFRIGHMGETTLEDVRALTNAIDAFLEMAT